MKQIVNEVIPFGGFKAMAIWPFIFIKGSFTKKDLLHEEIHGAQQKELLLIGFYVLYALCFIKELVHCLIDKGRGQIVTVGYKKRNYIHRVEHAIIFEREAYAMQNDEYYLERRKHFAWSKF